MRIRTRLGFTDLHWRVVIVGHCCGRAMLAPTYRYAPGGQAPTRGRGCLSRGVNVLALTIGIAGVLCSRRSAVANMGRRRGWNGCVFGLVVV